MIAKKLLACAKPAPIDPGNTLFLSNWLVAGTPPAAQIGTLGDTPSAVTSAGVLSLYGDVLGVFDVQAGSLDSWVVDLFIFEQGPLPSISISASAPGTYYMAVTSGNSILLSADGFGWITSNAPARQPGKNHLAFGLQAGKMQAWLNGVRFVDDSTAPVPPLGDGSGGIYIYASPTGIGPVRIVGADIYGDSAFIAVPTEPLGIV